MFRLIKVLVIIVIVCLVIWYGYSWAFNKVIPKPNVPAVATAISETVDAIPTVINGNSQWSIGQVIDVRVEDFVVQALVVDESKSWYVVDSVDLDLWRCESTDTDTCQPTTVNCEGKVSFDAMKIETELYKECY